MVFPKLTIREDSTGIFKDTVGELKVRVETDLTVLLNVDRYFLEWQSVRVLTDNVLHEGITKVAQSVYDEIVSDLKAETMGMESKVAEKIKLLKEGG